MASSSSSSSSSSGLPEPHGVSLYKKMAADLLKPVTDPKLHLAVLAQINNSKFIDEARGQGSLYALFLDAIVPALSKLLSSTNTNAQTSIPSVAELRYRALEVFVRLPNNEHKQKYATSIMQTLRSALENDPERNTLLALKIMRSLFSAYTSKLDTFASLLFKTIEKRYRETSQTVASRFSKTKKQTLPFVRGRESFKVLGELPRMTLTLLKKYPSKQNEASNVIEQMMSSLPVHPTSVQPSQSAAMTEFAISQMTMLSSLFSLPPSVQSQTMAKYEKNIVTCIVQLLRSCPVDNVATRKRLLHLARVFVATSVGKGFANYMDDLLDEKNLVGQRYSNVPVEIAPLRLAAYITMAEVVKQPHLALTLKQITRVIIVFSMNVHNCNVTTSIQKVSLRALLNLVKKINIHIDHLLKQKTDRAGASEQCRQLLDMILRTVVAKVENVRETIPRIKRECDALADFKPADSPEWFLRRQEARLQADAKQRKLNVTGRRRSAANKRARTLQSKKQCTLVDARATSAEQTSASPSLLPHPTTASTSNNNSGNTSAQRLQRPPGAASIDALLGNAPMPAQGASHLRARSRANSFSSAVLSPEQDLKEPDEDGPSIERYYQHLFCGKSFAAVVCMDDKDPFSRPDRVLQKLIKDLKDLLREIVDGINTVVYCIGRVTIRSTTKGVATLPTPQLLRFHRAAMECYELFDLPSVTNKQQPVGDRGSPDGHNHDKLELMRSHASVFSRSVPECFRDVITLEIDGLFRHCHRDPSFRLFIEKILHDPKTALVLIDVAMKSLVDEFGAMAESRESGEITRIHHFIFQDLLACGEKLKKLQASALSSHQYHHSHISNSCGQQFEQLLEKYLFPLLTNLLNMALRDHSAPQALQLLTALIRSVSTSKLLLEKFEKHISSIVTCLMHLYDRSASERLHERLLTLCIICLIMPTRKIYVRDLPLYLRPVVLSLNMPQFTKVAIRIIEWWVDLVSPDQLYRVLRNHPMLDLLGRHLFRLVKDNDSRHCSTVLRLLGKLGGRNRLFVEKQQRLNFETSAMFASLLQVEYQQQQDEQCAGRPVVLECNHILKYAISYLHRHFQAFVGSGADNASGAGPLHSASRPQSAGADLSFANLGQRKWFADSLIFPSDTGAAPASLVQKEKKTYVRRAELQCKLDSWRILRSGFSLLFRQYQQRKQAVVPLPVVPVELSNKDQADANLADADSVDKFHLVQSAVSRTLEAILKAQADADLRASVKADCRMLLRQVVAWAFSSNTGDPRSSSPSNLADDIETVVCRPILTLFANQEPTIAAIGFDGVVDILRIAISTAPSSSSASASAAAAAAGSPWEQVRLHAGASVRTAASRLADQRRSCFSRSLHVVRDELRLPAAADDTVMHKELHVYLSDEITGRRYINRLLIGFVNQIVQVSSTTSDAVLRKCVLLLVGLCSAAGPQWVRQHHLKLIQVLLFIVSKHQNTVPGDVIDAVQVALTDLLIVNFSGQGQAPFSSAQQDSVAGETPDVPKSTSSAAPPPGSMEDLVPLICEHLVSASKDVRLLAQQILLLVAQLRGTSVVNIMSQFTDIFKAAVFPSALALHPPAKQCAILDALLFVISVNSLFLRELSTKHLVQIVSDALRITASHTPKPYVPRLPADPPVYDHVQLCRHRHVFDLKDQIEQVRRRNRAQKHDSLAPATFPLVLQAEFRMAVLRLTSLLLRSSSTTLPDKENGQLREYFVHIVRGSLETKVPEIMQCALDSFVDVIRRLSMDKATTGISKELLSKCLDPILHHLTDYRQLSVTLLLQLRFLLQAMKRRFNAQIVGGALLRHLNKWADPLAIMRCESFHRGEEVLIASRLLGLFHLLPEFSVQSSVAAAAASGTSAAALHAQNTKATLHERRQFMEGVIATVARLEHEVSKFNDRTRGSYSKLTSPFREPLFQYLDANPKDTICSFCKETMYKEPSQSNDSLREARVALVEAFVTSPTKARHTRATLMTAEGIKMVCEHLLAPYPPADQTQGHAAMDFHQSSRWKHALSVHCIGLRVVHSLAMSEPGWLSKQAMLYRHLLTLWYSKRRQALVSRNTDPNMHTEAKLLAECLMIFAREKPTEIDIVFELLRPLLTKGLVDYTFLREFYLSDVAGSTYALQHKRRLVRRYIVLAAQPQVDPHLRLKSLEMIVLPVLTTAFQAGQMDVVNSTMLKQLLNFPSVDPRSGVPQELHAELLKLTCLIVRYYGRRLPENVTKYITSFLQGPDGICKYWAFVSVCTYIRVNPKAPAKAIVRVYDFLLHASAPEARPFVFEALRLLMPVFAARMGKDLGTAIRLVKKVAYEEGVYNVDMLRHVWEFILRYPVTFFPYRSEFYNLIKFTVKNFASAEPKLVVDIMHLEIVWAQQAVHELSGRPAVAVPDSTPSVPASSAPKPSADTATATAAHPSVPSKTPAPQTSKPAHQPVAIEKAVDEGIVAETLSNVITRVESIAVSAETEGPDTPAATMGAESAADETTTAAVSANGMVSTAPAPPRKKVTREAKKRKKNAAGRSTSRKRASVLARRARFANLNRFLRAKRMRSSESDSASAKTTAVEDSDAPPQSKSAKGGSCLPQPPAQSGSGATPPFETDAQFVARWGSFLKGKAEVNGRLQQVCTVLLRMQLLLGTDKRCQTRKSLKLVERCRRLVCLALAVAPGAKLNPEIFAWHLKELTDTNKRKFDKNQTLLDSASKKAASASATDSDKEAAKQAAAIVRHTTSVFELHYQNILDTALHSIDCFLELGTDKGLIAVMDTVVALFKHAIEAGLVNPVQQQGPPQSGSREVNATSGEFRTAQLLALTQRIVGRSGRGAAPNVRTDSLSGRHVLPNLAALLRSILSRHNDVAASLADLQLSSALLATPTNGSSSASSSSTAGAASSSSSAGASVGDAVTMTAAQLEMQNKIMRAESEWQKLFLPLKIVHLEPSFADQGPRLADCLEAVLRDLVHHQCVLKYARKFLQDLRQSSHGSSVGPGSGASKFDDQCVEAIGRVLELLRCLIPRMPSLKETFVTEISRLLALWQLPLSPLQRASCFASGDAMLLSHVLRTLGRSIPTSDSSGRNLDLRGDVALAPWLTAQEVGSFIVQAWGPVAHLRQSDPTLVSCYLALNLRFVKNLRLCWAAQPVADAFRLAWEPMPRFVGGYPLRVRGVAVKHDGLHGFGGGRSGVNNTSTGSVSRDKSFKHSTSSSSSFNRNFESIGDLPSDQKDAMFGFVHDALVVGLLTDDVHIRRDLFSEWYTRDFSSMYTIFRQVPGAAALSQLRRSAHLNKEDRARTIEKPWVHHHHHHRGCVSDDRKASVDAVGDVSFYTVLKALLEYDWGPLARARCNFLPVWVDVLLLELGKGGQCRTSFSPLLAKVREIFGHSGGAFSLPGESDTSHGVSDGNANGDGTTTCDASAVLLESVRTAAYHHPLLATKIFLQLLPVLWARFSRQEQQDLVPSFISFLSRPWLNRAVADKAASKLFSMEAEPNMSAGAKLHSHGARRSKPSLFEQPVGGGCRQVVLTVLSLCGALEPRPLLPSTLLSFLADQHECWYRIAPLLTANVASLALAAGRSASSGPATTIGNGNTAATNAPSMNAESVVPFHALQRMYTQLNAKDLLLGVYRHFSSRDDARRGLVLQAQHYWEHARQAYAEAITAVEQAAQLQLLGSDGKSFVPTGVVSMQESSTSEHEVDAWRKQWAACSVQLGDWARLRQFAVAHADEGLERECQAKLGNWSAQLLQSVSPKAVDSAFAQAKASKSLARVLSNPTQAAQRQAITAAAATAKTASQAKATPRTLLAQLYAVVANLSPNGSSDDQKDFDSLYKRCEARLLRQWARLPVFACQAHAPLLELAQLLLEASESAKITRHIAGHDFRTARVHGARRIDEVKQSFLLPWRKRLPTLGDPMSTWDDCLTWRVQFFDIMRQKFRALAPTEGDASLLHDAPWTVTTLAHAARRKKLNIVAHRTLAKLTMKHMERIDGFNKVREQLLIHYHGRPNKAGWLFGLDLVNSIISAEHMNSFRADEQAELFRIKGMFLRSLYEDAITATGSSRSGGASGNDSSSSDECRDLAHKAFSRAAQASSSYSKAWFSWGTFLHQLLTRKSSLEDAAHGGVPPALGSAQQTVNQTQARQILDCLLQAVTYDTARAHLSMVRVLSLLAGYPSPAIAKTFAAHKNRVPFWVWLPWITQLIAGLSQPEGPMLKPILARVILSAPQAVFYQLLHAQDTFALAAEAADKASAEADAAAAAAAAATAAAANNTVPAASGSAIPNAKLLGHAASGLNTAAGGVGLNLSGNHNGSGASGRPQVPRSNSATLLFKPVKLDDVLSAPIHSTLLLARQEEAQLRSNGQEAGKKQPGLPPTSSSKVSPLAASDPSDVLPRAVFVSQGDNVAQAFPQGTKTAKVTKHLSDRNFDNNRNRSFGSGSAGRNSHSSGGSNGNPGRPSGSGGGGTANSGGGGRFAGAGGMARPKSLAQLQAHSGVNNVRELLGLVKRAYTGLFGEMDLFVKALLRPSLRPSVDEQLHSAVVLLLKKCFAASVPMESEVPESLKSQMQQVCRRLFQTRKKGAVDSAPSNEATMASTGNQAGLLPGSRIAVDSDPNQQRGGQRFVDADASALNSGVENLTSSRRLLATEFQQCFQPFVAANSTRILPCGQRVPTDKRARMVANNDFPASLGQLVRLLKTWQRRLSQSTTGRPKLDLFQCSRYLASLSQNELQIPGQYATSVMDGSSTPHAEHFLKLHHVGCKVEAFRRHGQPVRRLALVSNHGHRVHFLLQFHTGSLTSVESRMGQFKCFLNILLREHSACSERNIRYAEPAIVPLDLHVRLQRDVKTSRSLHRIYGDHCASERGGKARDLDYWAQFLRLRRARNSQDASCSPTGSRPERPSSNAGASACESTPAAAAATTSDTRASGTTFADNVFAFEAICGGAKELDVPPMPVNVLSNFVHTVVPSAPDLFAFKENFAHDHAAISFLTYVLCMNNLPLETLSVDFSTGHIYSEELQPVVSSGTGLLARADADVMPFRLTRNVQDFVGPFRLSGTYAASMAAIAGCLAEEEQLEFLRSYLELFFCDSLRADPRVLRSAPSATSSPFSPRARSSSETSFYSSAASISVAQRSAHIKVASRHNMLDVVKAVERLAVKSDAKLGANPVPTDGTYGTNGVGGGPRQSGSSNYTGSVTGPRQAACQPRAGQRPRWGLNSEVSRASRAGLSSGSQAGMPSSERPAAPEVDQHILDLIIAATDPQEQAQIPVQFSPWF